MLAASCTSSADPVVPPPPPTPPAPTFSIPSGEEFFVAPGGSDDGAGTADEPWATLRHGLEELRPGQTLTVRGGEYREQLRGVDIRRGRPDARILVRAAPGERPVIRGLLGLDRPSYWTFDGINVTWDEERNDTDQHLVKITDGEGWVWANSEIWGARSFANLLVTGSRRGEPADWQVTGNCIHDALAAHEPPDDNNVYIGDMNDAGPGLIERNLIFNATNGRNLKLGGPDSAADQGPQRVTVRHNTLVNSITNVVVSGGTSELLIEDNIFVEASAGYLVRGYNLTGDDVVFQDNVGAGADTFFFAEADSIVRGPGNDLLQGITFDASDRCGGFRPEEDAAAEHGRWAAG